MRQALPREVSKRIHRAALAGTGAFVVFGLAILVISSTVIEVESPAHPLRPTDAEYHACLADPTCDWQRLDKMRDEFPPARDGVSQGAAWALSIIGSVLLATMAGSFAAFVTWMDGKPRGLK